MLTREKLKIVKNSLIYLPDKSVIRGKWSLNSGHNLVLDLKDKKDNRGRLALKGKISAVSRNSLDFKIKAAVLEGKGKYPSKILALRGPCFLKLKGRWRADKFNRLTFEAGKKDNPDILTFKGAWDLSKDQKIIYTYRKKSLKRKRESVNSLVFDGSWRISEKNRLKFILTGSNNSFFDFRAQLQTPTVYPERGRIKYRIGIGAAGEKEEKVICLYGQWKFSRRLGLSFDMDYGKGRILKNQFRAGVNLNEKSKIIFDLRDRHNKPLGISVVFKHKPFSDKDLEYFLELKKKGGKDFYIGTGMKVNF